MSISFETAFGLHESALKFRGERANILANNLANADTPNYKAKDIDFKAALRSQENSYNSHMSGSNSRHINNSEHHSGKNLMYEVPVQPNIDGNTVETQVEHAKFAENALQYQASFTLLNSKMKGLITAIRGE